MDMDTDQSDKMDELAEQIASVLDGSGLTVLQYGADGNETSDRKKARRFFVIKPNILITIDEGPDAEDNVVRFNKGKDVDPKSVMGLWMRIRNLASDNVPPMNTQLDTFGKSITPRDFADDVKNKNKELAMNENLNVNVNSQLMGRVVHFLTKTGTGTTAAALVREINGTNYKDMQRALNKLKQDGKITIQGMAAGTDEPIYTVAVEEAVLETSDAKLEKHRKALYKASGDADKAGDTKTADKRFKQGIAADVRQIDRAAKPKQVKAIAESFSKMFGSSKTSQQTLENVKILVRHKTPVSEEVRGSRTRHISAIFLECNGERMRFQHNYLPGARAMAQHMAHGGTMNDKVGSYISESTSQLLKLQSFNRYVTTNKLINEDSSGIIETIKENIQTLRTELKKLTGSKTYETVKARVETFEREALAEDDTSNLKDLFTIRRFDEKFEEVLPIVKQLVQEKDTYHKRIEEAAGVTIVLRRETMSAVPMFEFASEHARLGYRINELALRITENDELAGFINKIGTKLCKEGTVNDFERAVLTQVLENVEIEKEKAEKKEITESTDIDAFFDRYTLNFF